MSEPLSIQGVTILPGFVDAGGQSALLDDLRAVVRAAPLLQPETPYGKPMSVRMTSAGTLGWVSDKTGYRYAPRRPSGVAWPPIPPRISALWHAVTGLTRAPDCCLVNYYGPGAKMGLHQDRDEADFSWPVVSLSLGDDALFRIGGAARGGKTASIWLRSGDVAVLAYHGIDRVRPGSSTLLPNAGRINVTLRVAG